MKDIMGMAVVQTAEELVQQRFYYVTAKVKLSTLLFMQIEFFAGMKIRMDSFILDCRIRIRILPLTTDI